MNTKPTAADILRATAAAEEAKLEAINEFKENTNEYGANNPDVIAMDGKGTAIDVSVRTQNMGVNTFTETNPYKSPE